VAVAESERNVRARQLFAPLAATYDRYASLLSFGQDPRWRRFLVSRVQASPQATVLDVATGTAAVAIELRRRYGCSVVGIDQSPEMLTEGRARVERAGLTKTIRLETGRAEQLPYPDASFDALTFTYLLRYVDDPAATMAELARVVKPGGTIAMLEFFVPPNAVARASWRVYTGALLPASGYLISPGWHEVGRFLDSSIRAFWQRYPFESLLGLWREAGIGSLDRRVMSLGGGIVIWGRRGD
jgi:demethylmenaquinone methyltransferase/2-methoxy-6-polyprenyl-1,4-benzoquinol methylase